MTQSLKAPLPCAFFGLASEKVAVCLSFTAAVVRACGGIVSGMLWAGGASFVASAARSANGIESFERSELSFISLKVRRKAKHAREWRRTFQEPLPGYH